MRRAANPPDAIKVSESLDRKWCTARGLAVRDFLGALDALGSPYIRADESAIGRPRAKRRTDLQT
jgi:hypothetical protein